MAGLASDGQDQITAASGHDPEDSTVDQQDATGEQVHEPDRVNGLMASLGKRTRERDEAIERADELQRQLDEVDAFRRAYASPDDVEEPVPEPEAEPPPPSYVDPNRPGRIFNRGVNPGSDQPGYLRDLDDARLAYERAMRDWQANSEGLD